MDGKEEERNEGSKVGRNGRDGKGTEGRKEGREGGKEGWEGKKEGRKSTPVLRASEEFTSPTRDVARAV